MLIGCAFFEGKVKTGCEQQFAAYVQDRLVPLWTRFPGAKEVRVLRQHLSDTDQPHYAMVLQIKYLNMAAVENALQSDIRKQSRAETEGLIQHFEGRIFHTLFDAAHDVALA
ncbi:MAG: hypothetical protein KGO94_11550 [Alphaproteobacteria bacterium]|nr:hypothetical protein [Alphaproteobacteria bacterium]